MAINGNTPINLTLSVDAINVVLGSLSTMPYERVAGLIANIQQQAATQIKEEAVEESVGGTD